ncbi:TetR/AcrR family transcriptional regulator C-terminal domain-containing protein [Dactylosporangium matsuzakiense]|uniref:Tetracycline repressor TetR C-terminal domain-containing protein n=1 Tax=Dactylosporangium matsuzakiense TaxID=53360 RepID=A0A9W6NSU5_9ACTN|nr:TetR/AcrR family transcriptional regulator C-terminal domain-containing protein [Dactylosporangium matsuzakiense]UWZ47817.1 TetR/AcrR family transcriptional regulator C-terminal domain-containing protein [Dactylosporangium matsuzakiense]GLL08755.1 hypothetical protein GCM10017581_105260 [Dactylosporangium matsuzakiense]
MKHHSLSDDAGCCSARTALYWHFRNKQELLDLMAQELQTSMQTSPPRSDESWPQWTARRARERRQLLLSRRDGARLVAGTRPGPAIAQQAEAELQPLVSAGFTPAHALRSITAIGHYVTGFVMEEQSARNRPQPDPPTSPGSAIQGTPTLAAAIREGGPPESTEAFEQGVAMLIDGMQALLQRTASREHQPEVR